MFFLTPLRVLCTRSALCTHAHARTHAHTHTHTHNTHTRTSPHRPQCTAKEQADKILADCMALKTIVLLQYSLFVAEEVTEGPSATAKTAAPEA